MKTLYISDLDGTLLNQNSVISDYTRTAVNRLIAGGLSFSIATARTVHSTTRVLNGLDLRLPSIQMNGVFLYNWTQREYIDARYLQQSAVRRLLPVVERHNAEPFIYTFTNGVQTTHFRNLSTPEMREFHRIRTEVYGQVMPQIENIEDLSDLIYFTFVNTREALAPLHEDVQNIPSISVAFYRDVSTSNSWLLEIYSREASKSNALLRLKKTHGFDRVIGFGDNLNDLPMFEICDESYAVENAVSDVKSAADSIIGANTDDGVARWLEENTL